MEAGGATRMKSDYSTRDTSDRPLRLPNAKIMRPLPQRFCMRAPPQTCSSSDAYSRASTVNDEGASALRKTRSVAFWKSLAVAS